MAFRPERAAGANEKPRNRAEELRSLLDFMHAGGHWDKVDPQLADQHRATLRWLQSEQQQHHPEQSLAQAAAAIIESSRATQQRSVGDMITLPRLGSRQWEIIKVDHGSRSYILADPRDQRSVEQIVAAVWSGEEHDGEPIGHEINWDELDRLAA